MVAKRRSKARVHDSEEEDDNDENAADNDDKNQNEDYRPSSHPQDFEHPKVFLRLRPMNKLEEARRSKDCVEFDDDPRKVVIDAPLQGLHEFECDMVFDEEATQREVFRQVGKSVPQQLLDGYNCAILAFGQTGTGKTHTMFGLRQGSDDSILESRETSTASDDEQRIQRGEDSNEKEKVGKDLISSRDMTDITDGVIAKTMAALFEAIRRAPPQIDFLVRLSFVELYLEKLSDLLLPQSESVRVGVDEYGSSCIVGAAELCCTCVDDVYKLLARGLAYRTQSATIQNADSSRSHAIVTVRIDQFNKETGMQCSSRLQMADLAGSELAKQKSSRSLDSAVGAESKMINHSLIGLVNMVRATIAEQGGNERTRMPSRVFVNSTKLAKLLQPCLGGGNCLTQIICTATPSSYNIGETINTIRVAQKFQNLKNFPKQNSFVSYSALMDRLTRSETTVSNLTELSKQLAVECANMSEDGGESKSPHSELWKAIHAISKECSNEMNSKTAAIEVTVKRPDEKAPADPNQDAYNRITDLEKQLEESRLAKEKAESAMRDMQSDLISLRSQNEILSAENVSLDKELGESKGELRILATRMIDLEHNFRTSQFRETEAVAFLRQFRSFYVRLLKSKAAQGSSDTATIMEDVAAEIGVAQLSDMVEIDTLMQASGLLEKEEVGQDTTATTDYAPSIDALSKSAEEASAAEVLEHQKIKELQKTEGQLSITKSLFAGEAISYRAKLLKTPAGRLAMKHERELEESLDELSKKCTSLQISNTAEKAMVEALSARQGAIGKIKEAQEKNMLKQELDRKSNDLQAIVWKMNELHLVNKTVSEKVDNREKHAGYLESHLADLQKMNRRLTIDRQEAEKKLRDEKASLKSQVDGLSMALWQLGNTEGKVPSWKLLIPFNTAEISEPVSERRLSFGELAATVRSKDDAITYDDEAENKRDVPGEEDAVQVNNESKQTRKIGIQTVTTSAVDMEAQTDLSGQDLDRKEALPKAKDIPATPLEACFISSPTQADTYVLSPEAFEKETKEAQKYRASVGAPQTNYDAPPLEIDIDERSVENDEHSRPPCRSAIAATLSVPGSTSLNEDSLSSHSRRSSIPTKQTSFDTNSTMDGSSGIMEDANQSMGSIPDRFVKQETSRNPVLSPPQQFSPGGTQKKKSLSLRFATEERQTSPISMYSNVTKKRPEKSRSITLDEASDRKVNPRMSPKPASKGFRKGLRRSNSTGHGLSDAKNATPEFVSVFREMGIKNEDQVERKKIIEVKEDRTSEWKDRARLLSQKDDTPKSPISNPNPSQTTERVLSPEYREKFLKMGHKGVEEVIERSGKKKVAPKKDDGAPEWMKKLRAQKDQNNNISLEGGKPADYQPRRSTAGMKIDPSKVSAGVSKIKPKQKASRRSSSEF